jgi:hypothetical protein
MNESYRSNELLQLPADEPYPEPVDGPALLSDIASRITSHVLLPCLAAETLALWVLHTYAFELRNVSTYISIESPDKRCGKTTLLRLLGKMVARPVIAANISSSAIFRVIEEVRPTLLIDEADTFLTSNDAMRGILNSGYERDSAYVVRVGSFSAARSRKSLALERFSCWCPKIIASIGSLPATLADRSITIHMHRKTAKEKLQTLRDYADGGLRSRCLRFVRDNQHAIRTNKPSIPETLADRAADVWEPLFVLADIAGGSWPETSRSASGVCQAAPDQHTPISALLSDIWVIFHCSHTDRLFTRELITALEEFGDRPYRPAGSDKPLTAAWLSRTLGSYGVTSRSLWKDGNVSRGYEKQDLWELFQRYMSKADVIDCVNEHKKVIADRDAHQDENKSEMKPLSAAELRQARMRIEKILALHGIEA